MVFIDQPLALPSSAKKLKADQAFAIYIGNSHYRMKLTHKVMTVCLLSIVDYKFSKSIVGFHLSILSSSLTMVRFLLRVL